MTTSGLLPRFQKLRASAPGDPHTLTNARLQTLWVLNVVKDDPELGYLGPAQIADILCDGEGVHLSRQKIAGLLQKEQGTVSRKRQGGKSQYKIMRQGIDKLLPASSSSVLVDPEKALTEIRKLEEILSDLRGDLKFCDPYVDNRTVDYLAECKTATSVKLLTVNILKESTLRRDLSAYERQYGNKLEVRLASGGLHDRYIVHEAGMLLLGTSLNGFTKKQSFLISLGPDIRAATERAFDRLWASAKKF